MNMQAQIVIDEYLEKHKHEICNDLERAGLVKGGEPVFSIIKNCAVQDATQLIKLLGVENTSAQHQIIHQSKKCHNACTIMYWVTFYLNATCGRHGCWAHRCYVDDKVFAIYCEKLESALGNA